ncbi:MAG TPA: hypothetical protein VIY52_03435 [Streptosporangiaceae bacterium]
MHGDQVRYDCRVDLAELAVPGEAGVVDQQVGPGCGDHPLQLGQVAGIGQVSDMGLHPYAVLAGEPPGQGAQPVAAAGGDGQVPALGSQLAGECFADSR